MSGLILGLHLLAFHSNAADCSFNPCQKYETMTPGVYARMDNGATAGVFRNSYDTWSAYAGWTWQRGKFGLTVAGVTGYPQANLLPMLAPSVLVGPIRIALLPKIRSDGATAVHIAFEKEIE